MICIAKIMAVVLYGGAFGCDETICLYNNVIRHNIKHSYIEHVNIVVLDVKAFIDVLEKHIV